MREWELKERRTGIRFPVAIPLKFCVGIPVQNCWANTFDISKKGMSFVTDQSLLPGTTLDMWLNMPDNGELIPVKGTVVWNRFLDFQEYKVGVFVQQGDLRPIPLVLRSIKLHSHSY